MAFQVGDRVGDYEIAGVLGAGGMGSVFQVRHVISDRSEALKILQAGVQQNTDLLRRFEHEIRIQASLNHPNIAGLYTAFQFGDQLLMVMELVEGQSLRDRLRAGPLEPGEALKLSIQLLGALGYAHERGVVHRDIKPANIMLTPSGLVKLLDFGIAASHTGERLTKTGSAVGSLHYMSPEQIRGERVDGRSDIYSFGATLFEMVTGKPPFDGDTDYVLMTAHLERTPPVAIDVNPKVPRPISNAIFTALAKDPTERFPTAEAFRTALDAATGEGVPAAVATATRRIIDPASLPRVKAELAHYIGPIAGVLVSRNVKIARDPDHLLELLAAEIPSTKDRARFLDAKARLFQR